MTDAVFFSIPMPPSTNGLYRNVRGRGRVRTDRYRGWINSAGWDVKEASLPKHTGPVGVQIVVDRKKAEAKKRDLDNCNKAVLDLLVDHQIIEDDNATIVADLRTRTADTDGRCHVYVWPLSRNEAA